MNIQAILNNMRLAFLLVFFAGMSGCGGDDSSESKSGSSISQSLAFEPATLTAQDASFSGELSVLYKVQLSEHVKVSDGSGFELAEVVPLSEDAGCQVASVTESSFSISATTPKVCNYRYRVVSADATDIPTSRTAQASTQSSHAQQPSSAAAVARVAVSADPSSTILIPISAVTLENQIIAVNLATELGKFGVDLSGYTLQTDVTLPYNPNSVAIANPTTNVIEYTPASGFQGVDRILFSYASSTDNTVLMGILDVAVAQEGNRGLTVTQHISYPTVVNLNEVFEIDISPYVTSHDDDDYQLVNVDAFDALVASKAPLDTTNKVFTFQSSSVGTHTVSFAVSDHNGAYEMGLIQIMTSNLNSAGDWDDLELNGKTFSAPLTIQDANEASVAYDTMLVDKGYSPRKFLAGFRHSSAEDYCASRDDGSNNSRLPTRNELFDLSSALINSPTIWPSMNQYLVLDDVSNGSPVGFNIYFRTVHDYDQNTAYYVTCIEDKQDSLTVWGPGSMIDVLVGQEANVSVRIYSQGGHPVSGKVVVAYDSSPSIDFVSNEVFTDGLGSATIRFSVPSKGTYSFKVRTEENVFPVNVNAVEQSDTAFVLTPFSTESNVWANPEPWANPERAEEKLIRSELTALGQELNHYNDYTFRLEPENPNIDISHEKIHGVQYVILRYEKQAFESEVILNGRVSQSLIGEAAGHSVSTRIYWLRGSECRRESFITPLEIASLANGSCLTIVKNEPGQAIHHFPGKSVTGPVNKFFLDEYYDQIADGGFIDLDNYFNGSTYYQYSETTDPGLYGLYNGSYQRFSNFTIHPLYDKNLNTDIYVGYARGFCHFLSSINFGAENNWYLPSRADFPSVIDFNLVKEWGWPDGVYGVIEDQVIYTGSLTESMTFLPLTSPLPTNERVTLGFCMVDE
ncbi:hypothetical protein [Vibrio coralliirubri]|uniref:hypothetical protein n=1 Tax=Vibrio coralliirubri TaxID=1516159 RepID=UPI000631B734|nr:hypothetical protein [Vibrio coralliirubri]CDT38777.1 exported hypothetical protein [Vibrio coralliirubri]